jgi:hypothetical protein
VGDGPAASTGARSSRRVDGRSHREARSGLRPAGPFRTSRAIAGIPGSSHSQMPPSAGRSPPGNRGSMGRVARSPLPAALPTKARDGPRGHNSAPGSGSSSTEGTDQENPPLGRGRASPCRCVSIGPRGHPRGPPRFILVPDWFLIRDFLNRGWTPKRWNPLSRRGSRWWALEDLNL